MAAELERWAGGGREGGPSPRRGASGHGSTAGCAKWRLKGDCHVHMS